MLADADQLVFVDVDDTIRDVHGYAKQGAAYGYSGVKGLNAQLAALSSPTSAPLIAAARLRRGNVVSGHGAARLVADAVKAARAAGPPGGSWSARTPATTGAPWWAPPSALGRGSR